MFNVKRWLQIFSLIFWIGNIACAEIALEVTEGIVRPWTLSFVPQQATQNLQRIITKNLNHTGCFEVIDENQTMQKADFKIFLSLIPTRKKLEEVELTLENQRRQLILKVKLQATNLKQLAYQISDLIYYQLTGIKGIFRTKLAYVYVKQKLNKLPTYILRIVDVNGEWEQDLLVSDAPIMSPTWSPDGEKIAYVSFEHHRAAIYIHHLTSGKRELITRFPGINGAPTWSPDGKHLVVVLTNSGYPKLYDFNLTTKQLIPLTKDWYIDTEPSFSPNGKQLVFTSNRGGSPQLYLLNLKHLQITRLTFKGRYNARGLFTPDGKSLIMLHGRDNLFCIAKQNLSNGTLVELTALGRYEAPSLSPNGEMIVCTEGKNLKMIGLRSEIVYTLPTVEGENKGEIREPTWSPFIK